MSCTCSRFLATAVLSALYISFPLLAANGFSLIDARSTALGGASVAIVSFQNNASLCFTDSHGAMLSFENRYGMKELSTYGAAAHYSFPFMVASLSFSRFGYEKYNETMVGIGLAKRLADWVSLGVRLHYANLYRSQEEGSDGAFSSDLSVMFNVANRLRIGLLATNLFTASLSEDYERIQLPFRMRGGLSYQLTPDFLTTCELDFTDGNALIGRVGFEYIAFEILPIRAGFTTTPLQPTFGVGYCPTKKWSIDIASSYHTTLGFSPTLSAQFNF